MNSANPKKLQQNVLFFIIYFFCRRGQENLYSMTRSTFRVFTESDGSEYVYQAIDEADKNHSPDDTTTSNEGRMYENQGNNMNLY